MSYSISEIAKMLNVSAYTIRYYDKEGLFPLVKRVNGIRVFEDKDFPWLRMLNCLKNLNMPIYTIIESGSRVDADFPFAGPYFIFLCFDEVA